MEEGEIITRLWWYSLSAVGVINVTLALREFFTSKRIYQPITKNERAVKICGLIYAICCAFRSILPRLDVERVCLVDSVLSYIAIGRTVATIAEISFAYQLSCTLSELSIGLAKEYEKANKKTNERNILKLISNEVSRIQFWMLVVANIFCWSSVITTNQIFHAVEETLWMLAALILFLSFYYIRSRAIALRQSTPHFQIPSQLQSLFLCFLLLSPLYIAFMIYVDIPMYLHRWRADDMIGKEYLNFISGVADSFQCKQFTKSFQFWKNEMPWMSGYFSVAVWFSIWLMRSPSFSLSPSRSSRKLNSSANNKK